MSDRMTRSARTGRRMVARRALAAVAALAIGAGVVTATSGAVSISVVEAREAARTAAVARLDSGHRASIAVARVATADARRTAAVTAANAELTRARGILASSAGKAAESGRAALSAAADVVAARASGGTAFAVTAAVVTLKESEKAVTDSVAAYEQAELQRLAAQAAATAAALTAAEYQEARSRTADPVAPSHASAPAPAAAAPYYAPGVTSVPPDNSGCGPCPGATLVLTPSGYWGCP